MIRTGACSKDWHGFTAFVPVVRVRDRRDAEYTDQNYEWVDVINQKLLQNTLSES